MSIEETAKYHLKRALEEIQKTDFQSKYYYIYRSKAIASADILGMPYYEIVDFLIKTFPSVPANQITDDLEFDEWVEWSLSEDKRKGA